MLGRTLYAHELYYMTASDNVYSAKKSRDATNDWTKWTKENPQAAELLIEVEKVIAENE